MWVVVHTAIFGSMLGGSRVTTYSSYSKRDILMLNEESNVLPIVYHTFLFYELVFPNVHSVYIEVS